MNDSGIFLPVCYIGTFEVAFDVAANLNVPLNASVLHWKKKVQFLWEQI